MCIEFFKHNNVISYVFLVKLQTVTCICIFSIYLCFLKLCLIIIHINICKLWYSRKLFSCRILFSCDIIGCLKNDCSIFQILGEKHPRTACFSNIYQIFV